jgi:hypothetical protein
VAERIRQDRAEAAKHDRLTAELEATGITVTDDLPDGAARLSSVLHDGEDLTAEAHAACSGRGAYFPSWNPLQPVYYCTSPEQNGHTVQTFGLPRGSGGTVIPDALPDDPPADSPPDPGRRLVIDGNKAWRAAVLTALPQVLAGGPLRRWLRWTNFGRPCSTAVVSSRGSGRFARVQLDRCRSSWSMRTASRSSRSRFFCGI